MTHEQAVEAKAVERYVRKEMPEAEIDVFEDHYLECDECFREITTRAITAENRVVVVQADARGEFLNIDQKSPPLQHKPWYWFLWPGWWRKQ